MARTDVDIWIPEEWNGPVIQKVNQTSAIESVARRQPMGTDTLHVPRSGNFTVQATNKGGTYAEDNSAVGQITLTARKLTAALRIAEEDKADTATLLNAVATKQLDWARTYAKYLDNATLAVTAAEDNDMTNGRPFTSLYYRLRHTISGTDYSDLTYAADTNYLTATVANFNSGGTTAGALNTGVGKLLDAVAILEEGDYFDEGEIQIVAHPKFKRLLRGAVGYDGHPVVVEGSADGVAIDTIAGYPVKWSLGAKTSPAASAAPAGNPLFFAFNRQVATVLGVRSGPETQAASAASGAAGFLTDEDLIKMRSRRAFGVGDPNAAVVVEIIG